MLKYVSNYETVTLDEKDEKTILKFFSNKITNDDCCYIDRIEKYIDEDKNSLTRYFFIFYDGEDNINTSCLVMNDISLKEFLIEGYRYDDTYGYKRLFYELKTAKILISDENVKNKEEFNVLQDNVLLMAKKATQSWNESIKEEVFTFMKHFD